MLRHYPRKLRIAIACTLIAVAGAAVGAEDLRQAGASIVLETLDELVVPD